MIMDGHRSPSPHFEEIDAALDVIQQGREHALAPLSGDALLLRLATVADTEACWWESSSERTRVRVHWRAALAARDGARLTATQCRRQPASPQVGNGQGALPGPREIRAVAALTRTGATR